MIYRLFVIALFTFSYLLTSAQSLSVVIAPVPVACHGDSTGSAVATVSGGQQPYTFEWKNSTGQVIGHQDTIAHLPVGFYTLKVTDSGGNIASSGTQITQPQAITLFLQATMPQLCIPAPDGAIHAVAWGGTPPFSFLWNTGDTIPALSGLTAGDYQCTATDANGCQSAGIGTVLFNNEGLWINLDQTYPTCPQGNNGLTEAHVMTGTPPYSFLWNTGSTNEVVENLTPGLYTVTITDQNGCVGKMNTTLVLQPSVNPAPVILNEVCQHLRMAFHTPDSAFYTSYTWASNVAGDVLTPSANGTSVSIEWAGAGPRIINVTQGNVYPACMITREWQTEVIACSSQTLETDDDWDIFYENPTDDILHLIWKNPNQASNPVLINIFDLAGKIVAAQKGNSVSTITINLAGIPEGLYFLQMRVSGRQPVVRKLVVR